MERATSLGLRLLRGLWLASFLVVASTGATGCLADDSESEDEETSAVEDGLQAELGDELSEEDDEISLDGLLDEDVLGEAQGSSAPTLPFDLRAEPEPIPWQDPRNEDASNLK